MSQTLPLDRTFGYHPQPRAVLSTLQPGTFAELLVFGPGLADGNLIDLVGEVRVQPRPEIELPTGLYWFGGQTPSSLLMVLTGLPGVAAVSVMRDEVEAGSSLDSAMGWFDHHWSSASVVPFPQFEVGQEVLVSARAQDGVVRARQYASGGWRYTVFADGRMEKLREADVAARPQVEDAAAWVQGEPGSVDSFAATLTRAKLSGNFRDTVYSFRATRTVFRPYQFKPVLKLLNTDKLRLLIADEVGLGKTIEAGLIWTEMEARRQADRVLVVCPSSLVSKWQREMEERFGFDLTELDNGGLDRMVTQLESGTFPRRTACVTSIERLRTWSQLEKATNLNLQFDLVIVDEAHSFRNSSTKSYELGEYLSQWTDALVMLSATPVNLRNRDLYNLLSILVPGEFEDAESLEERLEPNRWLNKIKASLTDPLATNSDRRQWLRSLVDEPFGEALSKRPAFRLLDEVLAEPALEPSDAARVKRLTTELHALSSEVTRTRKVDVQEVKALREPVPIPVRWTDEEQSFYDEYLAWCVRRADASGSPLHFAMQMPLRLAGSCLPAAAETVLSWNSEARPSPDESRVDTPGTIAADIAPHAELVALAANLSCDSKLTEFRRAIEDLVLTGKQALVFTFSRRTLDYLRRQLAGDARVVVMTGSVPRKDRDRLMREFREGAFDIMIATRVASEGLDFEFCSAVVNYDLPWNPMEIEQRIGRIDRIGQREDKIAIRNFHTPGTIETDILERVFTRIGIFEHAIGDMEPILDSAWSSVEDVIFDFTLSDEQRTLRENEAVLALEEKKLAQSDIESAAPMLLSSDGADIDGLEQDLESSGRYLGQPELALVVADWARMSGGRVTQDGKVLRVRGSAAMADEVQSLVRTGERVTSEVSDLIADLQSQLDLTISIDQEHSRQTGIPLLTAVHPLTRAAHNTPGYRQSRFTSLSMPSAEAGVPQGEYLVLLSEARWDGVRPIHEVWSSAVSVTTLASVGPGPGHAVLAALARGELMPGPVVGPMDLLSAADAASLHLAAMEQQKDDELTRENAAIFETREVSLQQVNARRTRYLQELRRTNVARGNQRAVVLTDARLDKQRERFDQQLRDLQLKSRATLSTTDLAVCVLSVTA